jgi:hypothetical protein
MEKGIASVHGSNESLSPELTGKELGQVIVKILCSQSRFEW